MAQQAIEAFQSLQAGFMDVIAHLEQEGVDLHAGKGHTALGITKGEFNKHALAAAVAQWKEVLHHNELMVQHPDVLNIAFVHITCITQLGNIQETLRIVKADVESDAGFAALKTTKADFEQVCHQAVTSAMTQYKQILATQNGPRLSAALNACMVAGNINPDDDTIYQKAGFKSRANFASACESWMKKVQEVNAARPPQHDCC